MANPAVLHFARLLTQAANTVGARDRGGDNAAW
jgi:hypothetical protein